MDPEEHKRRQRMMDMGPRRSMDMAPRRPHPTEPVVAPPQQPQVAPRPVARPVRPAAPVPQPVAQSRPVRSAGRPASARHEAEAVATEAPAAPKSGGWRTFLQVLIGLVVIAAVASAIVVLYIRYYQ